MTIIPKTVPLVRSQFRFSIKKMNFTTDITWSMYGVEWNRGLQKFASDMSIYLYSTFVRYVHVCMCVWVPFLLRFVRFSPKYSCVCVPSRMKTLLNMLKHDFSCWNASTLNLSFCTEKKRCNWNDIVRRKPNRNLSFDL